jgi:sigma-B regulation protein RsbU (phosphoserine phosphatase)
MMLLQPPLGPPPVRRAAPFDAGRELARLAGAQRQLLPQAAPAVPGYDLTLAYRPACAATGDYHDFFLRPDGRWAVFVGDGSGHGPAACVLAATARAVFRTHPGLHGTPGASLTVAGRLLHELIPADLFLTGIYLLLGDAGGVSWASAGHEPPLRVTPAGRVAPPDLAPLGLPLGVEAGESYATVHWELAPGERLVVFTDGLVETRDAAGQAFGRPRLRRELAGLARLPLAGMVRELVARAADHRGGADFEDDFTVVGIERWAA